MSTKITEISVRDIRFPTSLQADGSDAMNDPDYSCAYVILKTDGPHIGYGLTFTIGKGTDIVCAAVRQLKDLVIGRKLQDIFTNFAVFWEEITQEPQLRWLGPEKGVTHLATSAVMNAIWDLWARIENKPLWKLLSDMEPEQLVSIINFRYLTDVLTKEEALDILRRGKEGKKERETLMLQNGYPAYTTGVGWLGYSDEKLKRLCKEAVAAGWTRFKLKVGANIEDDIRRLTIFREEVGYEVFMGTDANQRWSVQEAIDWMKQLAKFKPDWIEEPTSPDDVLGHAAIAKALNPLGIGVATGESCQNRVMFKQFLQAKALQYCQIDAGRLAGPSEIVAVVLMAAKFGVPICPHAGGVGLCEMVQHIPMFDFVAVSGSMDKRVIEHVMHLHEHFVHPIVMKGGHYMPPTKPGYSVEMKIESLDRYEYPNGPEWQKLFKDGIYSPPS